MSIIIVFAGFILVYVLIVRPRIKTYKYIAGVLDGVDSRSLKGWALIKAKFAGYKTVVLSSIAGVFPMLPSALDELKDYTGWAAFLEQATANKVAAVCAALAMITHAIGLENAAKAKPKT